MIEKKTKKKFKTNILIMIVLLIIVLVLLFFIVKALLRPKNELLGTWTTDGITIYQFDENDTGKMIASSREYEFTYKVSGDKLTIDFKNEKSADRTYDYSIEDDKLILKFENKTYTFVKK